MNRPSWDQTFIEICHVMAKRSKDESTKVGAVIIGPDKEVVSVGYNCFPRGMRDNVKERQKRPDKYYYFVHAEANAIYNATRIGASLKNCILYIPWHPCSKCAVGIIQVGILEVVLETFEVQARWKNDCNKAAEMFMETHINIRKMLKSSS